MYCSSQNTTIAHSGIVILWVWLLLSLKQYPITTRAVWTLFVAVCIIPCSFLASKKALSLLMEMNKAELLVMIMKKVGLIQVKNRECSKSVTHVYSPTFLCDVLDLCYTACPLFLPQVQRNLLTLALSYIQVMFYGCTYIEHVIYFMNETHLPSFINVVLAWDITYTDASGINVFSSVLV